MNEFPSDDEPSMVQEVKFRRLRRRKMYRMPKIRSTATRAPPKGAPTMAPGGME